VLWVVFEAGKLAPISFLTLRHTAAMHRYVGSYEKLNASAAVVDCQSHQMTPAWRGP
jgi:hypothetical protein